jgi:hypothetical protein
MHGRYGSHMEIDFRAWADAYTIGGATVFEGDRLSDFLDDVDEVAVERATVRALDDGRKQLLRSALIQRDELCIVAATGPRGRADRRHVTRAYPVRAEVGPYAVVGYFHALPTVDPFGTIARRRVVALKPVRLSFVVAGERIEETHDTLLLMRAKIDSIEPASDAAVDLRSALELSQQRDRQAKDVTAEDHARR